MLPLHPLCEEFPLPPDARLQELANSIRKSGLVDDIITLDGKVLDGRCRQLGCKMAGREPRYREWAGEGGTPMDFVYSKNYPRRDLSPAQRAMIAASFAAKMGHTAGDVAAKSAGASETSTRRAAKVQAQAAPEVAAAVKNGKVQLRDAEKMCDLPVQEQRAAVAKVESGEAKTLQKALEPEPEAKQEPRDSLGAIVPKELRDSFGDQALTNMVAYLTKATASVKSVGGWNGWLLSEKVLTKLREASTLIQQAVPYAVHPKCHGKGCAACRQCGFVPEAMVEDMRAKMEW